MDQAKERQLDDQAKAQEAYPTILENVIETKERNDASDKRGEVLWAVNLYSQLLLFPVPSLLGPNETCKTFSKKMCILFSHLN